MAIFTTSVESSLYNGHLLRIFNFQLTTPRSQFITTQSLVNFFPTMNASVWIHLFPCVWWSILTLITNTRAKGKSPAQLFTACIYAVIVYSSGLIFHQVLHLYCFYQLRYCEVHGNLLFLACGQGLDARIAGRSIPGAQSSQEEP